MKRSAPVVLAGVLLLTAACAQAPRTRKPATTEKKGGSARPMNSESANKNRTRAMQVATFAGGCFWCTEAVFSALRGVSDVVSGYTGGTVADPTYERVCTGATGHAEAVQITFDPAAIGYKDLLKVFFTTHDPTTLNRQGADVGTQYRSAVFYADDAQKQAAVEVIQALTNERVYPDKIVTEVTKLGPFYRAEDYHQDYYRRNPNQGYCAAVIGPKLAKFRAHYRSLLKTP